MIIQSGWAEMLGMNPWDDGFLEAIPPWDGVTVEEFDRLLAQRIDHKPKHRKPLGVPTDRQALHLFALGRGVRV